ncbi:MAG TPA: Gfo/Idh/MocA family oxidoreductase [Planctomycetota bacterium]|nr:Gfo/Idh/MocA family oxidoreductase [Planctomycetota bacterium]
MDTMNNPEPRICIVGAGALSSRRIYPYVGLAGGRIVGACDLDRHKAETNARRFGGTAYTQMEAMLDAEKPDGVIICIGPEAHAALAPVVMRRGIPVYTEKPPAPSAAAALEVARVSKHTGVLCTTAFKKRYSAVYAKAREWVESFPPSDLYSISVDYCSGAYADDPPSKTFLLDFAVHCLDLVQYLFGDVDEVYACAKGRHAYAVSLRFRSGAVGSMNLNDGRCFHIPTEELELTARGGNSISISNSSSYRIVRNGKESEWRLPPTFTSAGDSGNDTGHLAELADFLAALKEGRSTRSCIYESYKSMALYEAIDESSRAGKPVRVEYQDV